MSPKRRDRAAPPPVGKEWDVRLGTSDAAKHWDEACGQAAKNTRDAFELMRSTPRPVPDRRHGQLKGELGTRSFEGRILEQWQIELTGAGRIWYLVDDDKHTVWIVEVALGHPKATE